MTGDERSGRRRATELLRAHGLLLGALPDVIKFAREALNDPKARRSEKRWAASVLVSMMPKREDATLAVDPEEPAA